MLDTVFSKSNLTNQLTIIAGPCSAESETQVMDTALELKRNANVAIFRAGLWKPRTRPGSFAGVGSEGLKWLQKVKEQTGLWVSTEVATALHVEKCLKAGIDLLWLGARTVTNPFAVQEIADALKNTDVAILIKNPVSPDTSLWIGAIERIYNSGIKNIGIIHRGFSILDAGEFRNKPLWEIVLEVKKYFPDIPVFCDPSHMSGDKNLICKIIKQALNYDISGLMIESHVNPDVALTDKKQQVTPRCLEKILIEILKINDEQINNYLDIEALRNEIDVIDYHIINLLKSRFNAITKIGELKLKENIPIFQIKRWEKIISSRLKAGNKVNLNEKFLLKIFKNIHEESIKIQNNIISNKDKSPLFNILKNK